MLTFCHWLSACQHLTLILLPQKELKKIDKGQQHMEKNLLSLLQSSKSAYTLERNRAVGVYDHPMGSMVLESGAQAMFHMPHSVIDRVVSKQSGIISIYSVW